MPTWWGTKQNVSFRLRAEVEAMRVTFGDTFRLVVPQFGAPLYWLGTIEINLRSKALSQREHELKIMYPNEFPQRAPEAYVLKPHIYSEKHQFEDGQLCLFNPKDGNNYGWNPSTGTAVTVAGWAIQWLYAYYTWRSTGEWPGQEERVWKQG
jgi:ubiquitin-protein ligase